MTTRSHNGTGRRPSIAAMPTATLLLALMIALGVATGPPVLAQETPEAPAGDAGIDLGGLKIADGVVQTGGMTVRDGCIEFDDGTTVGDCGRDGDTASPPEQGGDPEGGGSAEPPEQTLEELAAECARQDAAAPEETTAEETAGEEDTGAPTEEQCEKILNALDDDGSGGEKDETTAPELEDTGGAGGQTLPEDTVPEQTLPEGTAPRDDPCPTAPPKGARRATATRAIDGDTVELSEEIEGADTVRLIGVDTPEVDDEVEPYGPEAAAFTAESLEGKDVLLELDEAEKDNYDRLLAYVWTGDGELFNEVLLTEGYAALMIVQPNDRHAACFEAAELAARNAGAGLWGLEETEPSTEETTGPITEETTALGAEDAADDGGEEGGREGLLGRLVDFASSGDQEPERTSLAPPEGTAPETTDQRGDEAPEAAGFGLTTPETTGPGSTEPEGTTVAEQYEPASEPPVPETDEPATSDTSGGFGVPPQAEPSPEPGSGRQSVPEPPAGGVESALPTQQTSDGPQAVLPETGGPSPTRLLLIPAAVALVAGSILLALLWICGHPGNAGRDEKTPGETR